jgi:multidrug efflux system membrane fusion protein
MKPTTVQFTVAQNDLAKVIERFNSGAKLPVTAYSSDNTRQIATGTLYAISNQMATSTGTVTLRASFANDDEALFPNEFVNVKMLVDTLSSAVLVPTPAVLSGAPGDYVYLVNADHTVSVRKVTWGRATARIRPSCPASRSGTRWWSTAPTGSATAPRSASATANPATAPAPGPRTQPGKNSAWQPARPRRLQRDHQPTRAR